MLFTMAMDLLYAIGTALSKAAHSYMEAAENPLFQYQLFLSNWLQNVNGNWDMKPLKQLCNETALLQVWSYSKFEDLPTIGLSYT